MVSSVCKCPFKGRSVKQWEVWVETDEVVVYEAGDEVVWRIVVLYDSFFCNDLPLIEA